MIKHQMNAMTARAEASGGDILSQKMRGGAQ